MTSLNNNVLILINDVYNIVEFWDGLLQILTVAIPIVVGAFSSKFIINSWQAKKDKFQLEKEQFELRSKIIKSLEESFYKNLLLLNNFVKIMSHEYTKRYFLESKEKKSVLYKMEIPKDEKEHPINKLSEEYKKFRKELQETTISKWTFFGILRTYFDTEKFDQLMRDISNSNHYAEQLVHTLVYSKNTDEFLETYQEFQKEFAIYKDLNHKLSSLLTTEKMRKTS